MRETLTKLWLVLLGLGVLTAAHGQTTETKGANKMKVVQQAEISGEYVSAGGKRIWVEREGKGAPIVLLAGGPANNHLIFQPYFSRLADQFEIVYYDYYRRGKSEPAKDYEAITFESDIEDLENLRKALGYAKWSVYGFSYGGMVAQGYALKYPKSVDKLVLANTLHSAEMWQKNHENINREIVNQFPEIWEQIQALKARGYRSSPKEMVALFDSIRGNELVRFYNAQNDAKRAKELGLRNKDAAYKFNKELYFTFVGDDIDFFLGGEVANLPDFRPQFKELKMPLLIVAGRFDRALYPKYSLQFKQFAPQAKFVLLEHSGGFAHVEEPETLFPLLKEFLEEKLNK